ncbi:MAG: aminotransferase class I/II-fold pyridoxal phosphate-dependent enzyme [Proteobacteria bacterium]|nr:aminotransferase class I/II-fold pyridoxal phosphate-dependent enzyme [Pseudomonadota bacterium]
MPLLFVEGSNAKDIAASLEYAMRSGALPPGATLPPVRQLAVELGVNPNTVAAAYARLRAAGRVLTAGRRGTRVAGEPPSPTPVYAAPAGLRDLAGGQPDAALLPRPRGQAWAQALAQPLDGAAVAGDTPLLTLARDWLQGQGLPGDAMGVFSGTLDAVERALRQHARPGDRVGVEDPLWPPLLALLYSLRLVPVPLAVDAQGMCVPAVEVLKDCAAVVLTPRAQHPTGVAMTAVRWKALRARLRASPHTLLILDDHWGPLSAAPLAMAGALPPLWLHVLSVSSSLGPDCRVAVVSGTPGLVQGICAHQALGPRAVSRWLQGLVAQLWRQASRGRGRGSWQHMAASYAARRAALARALHRHGVAGDWQRGEGLHAWLPVADEAAVVQHMAARGWAVQAGAPLRLASGPGVRINLAALSLRDMGRLARDLAAALRVVS